MNSKKYATTPISSGYPPELDVTPLLSPNYANFYQQWMGILRWTTELGRVDILFPTTILSSYMTQPCEGHLKQALCTLAYLKHHSNVSMLFDDSTVNWNTQGFLNHDWTLFYRDAFEAIPPNMPKPRGHEVQINAFVDADHASNQITRRSHTGIIIYVNRTPIVWYSKSQNTVKSSTFGSEFIATKIAVDQIEAFRYKLRMFGVPLDGPANVFVDNQSVVLNATNPTSVLKKKHNAIACHRIHEAIAANMIRIAKVAGKKEFGRFVCQDIALFGFSQSD